MSKPHALFLSTVLLATSASAETLSVVCHESDQSEKASGLTLKKATLRFDSNLPSAAKINFRFQSSSQTFSVAGPGHVKAGKFGEGDIWLATIKVDHPKYSHASLYFDPIDPTMNGEISALGGLFFKDGKAVGGSFMACETR